MDEARGTWHALHILTTIISSISRSSRAAEALSRHAIAPHPTLSPPWARPRTTPQTHLWLSDSKASLGVDQSNFPPGLLDKARDAWRTAASRRSAAQQEAAEQLHALLEQLQLEALCGGEGEGQGSGSGGGVGMVGRLAANARAARDGEFVIDVAVELDGGCLR